MRLQLFSWCWGRDSYAQLLTAQDNLSNIGRKVNSLSPKVSGMRVQGAILLLLSCALVSKGEAAHFGHECGDNPMKQVLMVAKRTGRTLTHVLTVLRDIDSPAYNSLANKFRSYAACVGLVDTGYFRKRGMPTTWAGVHSFADSTAPPVEKKSLIEVLSPVQQRSTQVEEDQKSSLEEVQLVEQRSADMSGRKRSAIELLRPIELLRSSGGATSKMPFDPTATTGRGKLHTILVHLREIAQRMDSSSSAFQRTARQPEIMVPFEES